MYLNIQQFFLRLTIWGGFCLIFLGNATANAAWATGNVQQYYKYVATIGSLVFPLSLIAFTCGMPPAAAYVIFIVIYILLIFVKLYIIKGLLAFPSIMFFREVLFPYFSGNFIVLYSSGYFFIGLWKKV